MNRLIITKMAPVQDSRLAIATAECSDFTLKKIDFEELKSSSILNNMYVGKVQNIVQNIQAAFIEIEKDVICYLPLSDLRNPIYVRKQGKKTLVAGDELLVQVIKEPIKTKAAVVTANLNFSGKYFVFTTGKRNIGISSKMPKKRGEEIKALIADEMNEQLGVIIRTNANDADNDLLLKEFLSLKQKVNTLLETAIHRTCFSKVYQEENGYLTTIKNAYMNRIEEIVTDDPSIYQRIQEYLQTSQPEDAAKLKLYENQLLPLGKLYNLQLQTEAALKKHVWLKSGAYLIIEQTEAMVVIDVNTGKFSGGRKDREDTFLKINKEAAREIAHQLTLRNLSGMILIDFISMLSAEAIQALIEDLVFHIRQDAIKTDFVDITKLGIVECTRKKVKKSLYETIADYK